MSFVTSFLICPNFTLVRFGQSKNFNLFECPLLLDPDLQQFVSDSKYKYERALIAHLTGQNMFSQMSSIKSLVYTIQTISNPNNKIIAEDVRWLTKRIEHGNGKNMCVAQGFTMSYIYVIHKARVQ